MVSFSLNITFRVRVNFNMRHLWLSWTLTIRWW